MSEVDGLTLAVFKCLGHPLRVRILGELRGRAVAGPSDLAAELDEELGNIAYHISILRSAGCVELAETQQKRGAIAHFYKLTSLGKLGLEFVSLAAAAEDKLPGSHGHE